MNESNLYIVHLKSLSIILITIFTSLFLTFWQETFLTRFAPAHFHSTNSGLNWKAEIATLKDGEYYVSGGRTLGNCDIVADGKIMSSTRGPRGSRINLSIGYAFTKSNEGPRQIEINCYPQKGFKSGIALSPALLPYNSGLYLQYYREFTQIWLAILAASFLLFEILSFSPSVPNEIFLPVQNASSWGQRFRNPFFLFGISSFLYAVSLSYFFFLWMSPYAGTSVHVLLRILFSLSFIRVVLSFAPRKLRTTTIAIKTSYVILTAIYAASIFLDSNYLPLTRVYALTHPFFGLTTLLAAFLFFRNATLNQTNRHIYLVSLVWGGAQLTDSYLGIKYTGVYNAPLFLTVIMFMISRLRRLEMRNQITIESTIRAVLCELEKKESLDTTLTSIAKTCFPLTRFSRMSVYLDAYCLGKHLEPHRKFNRIFEAGYSKDTEMDQEIYFADKRGARMLGAMENGNVDLYEGDDKSWFLIVPIGRLACINLSDASVRNLVLASESLRALVRVYPAILPFESRLLAANLNRNPLLQRIKASRGIGTWPVQYAAIVLDISDFSQNVNKFKLLNNADVYSEFILAEYIPALIKSLRPYAELETDEGDKVLLVVVPDFLDNLNADEILPFVISKLIHFITVDGIELASQKGFPPIEISAGVSFGSGTLICDEFKVRIAGQPATFATRLQEASRRNTILIDENLGHKFEEAGFFLSSKRTFIVKKDRLSAFAIDMANSKKSAA